MVERARSEFSARAGFIATPETSQEHSRPQGERPPGRIENEIPVEKTSQSAMLLARALKGNAHVAELVDALDSGSSE